MEPRRSNSIQPSPTSAKEEEKNPFQVAALYDLTGIAPTIDRRTLAIVLFLGLIMIAVGVIAFGLVIQPSALVDTNTDNPAKGVNEDLDEGAVNGPKGGDGSDTATGTGASEEQPKPPVDVDWDEVYATHSQELKEAGSFSVRSDEFWDYDESGGNFDPTEQDYNHKITWDVNLDDQQALIKDDSTPIKSTESYYVSGTDIYLRDEGRREALMHESGSYTGSLTDLGLPELDPLREMEFQHHKRGSYDVYISSGIGAAPDSFLQYDKSSFQGYEYELIVSDQGLITEYSYEIIVKEGGKSLNISGLVKFKNVGNTTVQEPDWLEEARATTG